MSPDEVRDAADRAEGIKPGRGRPTKYQAIFATQAEKLCLLGATDPDLADFFEVSIRTIERWRSEHDDFCRAIKDAKETADARVERSLYQKALGYTFDSEKVFNNQGEIVRAPIREHVPPDTTAAIFWLKNRKPEQWREKIVTEHTGAIETREISDTEAARRVALLLTKAARSGETT